jgi:hypothetical protein
LSFGRWATCEGPMWGWRQIFMILSAGQVI